MSKKTSTILPAAPFQVSQAAAPVEESLPKVLYQLLFQVLTDTLSTLSSSYYPQASPGLSYD